MLKPIQLGCEIPEEQIRQGTEEQSQLWARSHQGSEEWQKFRLESPPAWYQEDVNQSWKQYKGYCSFQLNLDRCRYGYGFIKI